MKAKRELYKLHILLTWDEADCVLAQALSATCYRTLTWREGTNAPLSSRFARVRVRAAQADQLREEERLLIEWPKGEAEPTRYFLSTLSTSTPFNLKNLLGEEPYGISMDYDAFVGADLSAHNTLSVRMNSHLRSGQQRFSGLILETSVGRCSSLRHARYAGCSGRTDYSPGR